MTADLSNSRPAASSTDGTVDAPPVATSFPTESLALPADLLDGGEVVILAIKPALWSILFAAAPWMLAGAALIAISHLAALQAPVQAATLLQAVLAIVGLRLGSAILQWVSRVYVLTNRRVMRIRGVFHADVFACPLVKIINTGVTVAPHEAFTQLGTIWFNTGEKAPDGSWYNVARPHEVHAEIRRAIERAIDRH